MKKNIADLEVQVAIDTVLMGWLSKVMNKAPNEVAFDLFDMSHGVRKRLEKRNGQWCEDKKVKYPNSPNILFKVRADRTFDNSENQAAMAAWMQQCKDETGHSVWDWSKPSVNEWRQNNLPPQNQPVPEIVQVTFTIADSPKIKFTQAQLETMMTEQFLLGLSDESYDKEQGQDVSSE